VGLSAELNPRTMMRNPVMFVVEVVAWSRRRCSFTYPARASLLPAIRYALVHRAVCQFCRGHAEGRARPGEPLRKARSETQAKRVSANGEIEVVPVPSCGPTTLCSHRLAISSGRWRVIEGVASVDESAITGESPGDSRSGWRPSAVTGGHACCPTGSSRILQSRGDLLDRMIALVEGAERQRRP